MQAPLQKAETAGKRRGRPSKASLKTPDTSKQGKPTGSQQAADDSAERRLSGRRSGRRHTKRSSDGRFYDQDSPAQLMQASPHFEGASEDHAVHPPSTEAAQVCQATAPEPLSPHKGLSIPHSARLDADISRESALSSDKPCGKENAMRMPTALTSPLGPIAHAGKARSMMQGELLSWPA